MVKSHGKKCQNCFRVTTSQLSMVKCRRNVNFEEIDSEPPAGKNDGF